MRIWGVHIALVLQVEHHGDELRGSMAVSPESWFWQDQRTLQRAIVITPHSHVNGHAGTLLAHLDEGHDLGESKMGIFSHCNPTAIHAAHA